MANNCLVTKLKGVVDNDNLEVYGKLKVFIPAGQTFSLAFCKDGALNTGITIDCDNDVDNVYMVDLPTPITFPYVVPDNITNPRVHADAALTKDTIVTFDNLYAPNSRVNITSGSLAVSDNLLRNISMGNYKFKFIVFSGINQAFDLTSCISDELNTLYMTNLRNKDIKLDLTQLTGPYSVPEFKFAFDGSIGDRNGNLSGTISDIVRLFPNTSVVYVYYSKISGNVSQLASLSSVNDIHVQATNVEGTVESMIEGMCTNRTDGTLHFAAHRTAVTFNGNPVPSIGGQYPGLQITFNSTGAVVAQNNVTLGTYNKTSGNWSYS